MPYSKTAWKDHIKDANGNVVQQGSPVNASNLNHIEEGLANASAFTAGELGQASAHSGVLNHTAAIGYGIAVTAAAYGRGTFGVPAPAQYGSQNRIGITDFHFLIAGVIQEFKNTLPAAAGNNVIVLDPAPSEGTRDDLCFLEIWRDQATQEWKYRPRTVPGVDFSKFSLDGFYVPGVSWANVNRIITAQGGNTAPVPQNTSTSMNDSGAFIPASLSSSFLTNYADLTDQGLYITGNGSSAAKASLKTYDGYVYAIPLFKVNRRNSGGYSSNNPNGAKDVKVVTFQGTGANIDPGKTKIVTFSAADYNLIAVGEEYYHASYSPAAYRYKIISKNGSNQATVQAVGTAPVDSIGVGVLASDRPDNLYSNIIAERDITDLRHKTYLVAPSYEQLLIDGTDQILRGASQVERKTAMRKTYVGVRKTPLDANHVFYASLDGTTVPEVGAATAVNYSQGMEPGPTGAAMRSSANAATSIIVNAPTNSPVTLEGFFKVSNLTMTGERGYLLFLSDSSGTTYVGIDIEKNSTFVLRAQATVYQPVVGMGGAMINTWYHIRLVVIEGEARAYINGKLLGTIALSGLQLSKFTRGIFGYDYAGWSFNGSMADLAVSKVDRGATFATLPADFIQGYADITPALNYQRRINSDAQTSQKTYASAKVKNATQEPGITVTKGTSTNTAAWEAGDKIKVRGLAGEVISGLIDSDTALTTIVSNTTNQLTLLSLAGLSVSDVVYFRDSSGFGDVTSATITAIDSATNTITVGSTLTVNRYANRPLYEITPSTSSPVVRSIISGTSTTIPGTWTNLASNEAEFTLGTVPGGLVAQDIVIEYSLNMPVGQGGLYQVYTSVLRGEVNGKALIPGTVGLTDDFAGKVVGSTAANPHKLYAATNGTTASIAAPGTEFTQGDYDAVKLLDNSLKVITTSVNGQQATLFIAVDAIRAYEDKYGKIPGAYTTAEKAAWLRANHSKVTGTIWAYGSGPGGNAAGLYQWNTATWVLRSSNPANTPALISGPWTDMSTCINPDGYVYYLVIAAASDGVTPSVLYVDHVNVSFDVAAKAGYDTLVPENSRRDAGLGGILYIRKTTREVESLFPGNDEDNGIVVTGNYVPTQEIATSALTGTQDVLLGMQGFVTTAGTNRAYDSSNQLGNAITRILGPGDDLNYKVDPQTLVSTAAYDRAAASGVLRYWYPDLPFNAGPSTAVFSAGVPTWATSIAEFLIGMPALVSLNGELLLVIRCRKRSGMSDIGLGGDGGAGFVRYYRLPGRPLVKL